MRVELKCVDDVKRRFSELSEEQEKRKAAEELYQRSGTGFDYEARIARLEEEERERKRQKRERKKVRKHGGGDDEVPSATGVPSGAAARAAEGAVGATGGAAEEEIAPNPETDELMKLMGFSGFS